MTNHTYAITYTNDPSMQRKFAQIKADSNQTARTLFINHASLPDKPIKIMSCRKITNLANT